MANIRVFPPLRTVHQTAVVNGRSYTGAPGSVQSVADFDGQILGANGWTCLCKSGPTSARPSGTLPPNAPTRGQFYFDETLGYTIAFDGATWRNPSSGAAV
jgi:hypothetical protein